MNPTHATPATRFKVGIFTVLTIALIGAITVFVNDRPFWWKPCQYVRINVEDATGLKPNSPIRSLGLEIGFLKTVELSETFVTLGICITAPVEVLPATRAYIRGEGFLGDKFVELKPVRYTGPSIEAPDGTIPAPPAASPTSGFLDWLVPSAHAADPPARSSREIPVGDGGQDMQALVGRVDDLVREMTGLTNNLRNALNPEELRMTMRQLNKTLESASRTLSPEGGLNQTAQRTLAKLEDAIEQLRDQMTRVNKGEGSVGMILNDPSYAEEIRQAIRNVNVLLSRVGGVRFAVDMGGEQLTSPYNEGRGWFQLAIWPVPDRYYLLGLSVDPRGRVTDLTTTTTVNGQTTTVTQRQVEDRGLLLTAMLGKVYHQRLNLAIGALHNDGAIRVGLQLGPRGMEERLMIVNDVYTQPGGGSGVDARSAFIIRPLLGAYLKVGIESWRGVDGQRPLIYGAGVAFDDQDIKLLFAFR